MIPVAGCETPLEYRLPGDWRHVPANRGGIYLFAPRFPSDYELGLSDNFSPIEVAGLIRAFFLRHLSLYRESQLAGRAVDETKALHIRTSYKLVATADEILDAGAVFDDVLTSSATAEQVALITNLLRAYFSHAAPIYIGMTKDQSLRDRLDQHIKGNTGLAERLARFEIGWGEVTFKCFPLATLDLVPLRQLEKLFQALTKPALSLS